MGVLLCSNATLTMDTKPLICLVTAENCVQHRHMVQVELSTPEVSKRCTIRYSEMR